MFKIERALTGLFELLKLRSQGNLPYVMLADARPTIELSGWALQNIRLRSTSILNTTAVVGPGLLGTFTQTEDWLVQGVVAESIAGGIGDLALLNVNLTLPGQTALTVASSQRWGATAAMTAAAAGETVTSTERVTPEYFFSPRGSVWTTVAHTVNSAVGPSAYARVLNFPV